MFGGGAGSLADLLEGASSAARTLFDLTLCCLVTVGNRTCAKQKKKLEDFMAEASIAVAAEKRQAIEVLTCI